MAKNTTKKNELQTQTASTYEEAPLISEALSDVLVTGAGNDVRDEAVLTNPLDAMQVAATQDSMASTNDAVMAQNLQSLRERMQQRASWKPTEATGAGPTTESAAMTPLVAPETPAGVQESQAVATVEPPSAAPEQPAAELTQPQQEEVQPEQQLDVAPALQPEAQPLPTGKMQQQNAQPAASVVKSEARLQVEEVLANGLVDMYKTMTPQEQVAFRQKGEEVSTAIEQMLHGFKATTKKVLVLIREWLRLIPRVNLYFLEQESKIKTDEILKLQRKLKKDRRNRVDIV